MPLRIPPWYSPATMNLLPALLALLLAAPVCGVDAADLVDLTSPIERNLPPERNAYTIWKEVLPAFVLPDDSSLKDSLTQAVDYTRSMPSGPLNEKLTEWLDAHHQELSRLKRANLQERCQLPEEAMSDLLAFPVSASLTAGKVLVLIARSHAANGE